MRASPAMVKPLSALSCILFCALLTTFTRQSAAIPLRSAEAVPDHWAQLLRADRYQLVPHPSWTTKASEPHPNTNTSIFRASLQNHVPSTARTYAALDLDLKPVSRTKIFRGRGDKSNFECHVHNAREEINIEAVISKVITVCEASWTSSQKVLMKLTFRDIGGPETLANGGGTFFVKMKDTFETVLPVAAAEAVRGRDLNGNRKGDGRFDVLVTVNTRTPWYYGIDGNCPPERYDLVTVILHEVYHNVLFAGSLKVDTQTVQADQSLLQSVSLYNDYRTRFDSFLMNSQNCAVLSYLNAQQLASQNGLTTNQLLADAVCSDALYWGYGNRAIAKLHSPRVFQRKSSIYHFDPNATEVDSADSLMFPTVRRGTAQHVVSERILLMQAVSLNPEIPGANPSCTDLRVPTPVGIAQQEQINSDQFHGGITPNIVVADEGSVGGFPTWGIVLLALFAFLLLAALLGLCLALCLRKKKRSLSFTNSFSFSPTTLGSSTSRYGPSSSRTSSTSKTTLSSFGWSSKKTKSKKSSSKKTTKHSSLTSTKPQTKDSSTYGKKTCPSSGKCIDKCYCMFCTPVTPPPPVASVHHYEPDCTPVAYKCKYKCRKHCSHKSSRKHSCDKSTKKTCKSTTMVCCKCYCCKYEPSTCKTSSRCCKSSSKSGSASSSPKCTSSHKSSCKRVTPPSTKPPSTKPPTTKATSSKQTSAKPASCKPTTTKSCRTCKRSCRTCKPSGNRCGCRSCPMVEINIC